MTRLSLKHATTLEERLAMDASQSRKRAMSLPPGQEREALLRKARRDEMAVTITKWLTFPRPQQPRRYRRCSRPLALPIHNCAAQRSSTSSPRGATICGSC
jgi:hypothetical protein